MLSLKQKFLIWLQKPRNRSRFIAGVIGAFVLVGVVLFSSQIGDLLSLIGGRAAISDEDLNQQWEQVVLSGGEKRAHAKLITVEQGDQAWLYVAGGIDVQYNVIEQRYQTVMVNSVQRIELDPQTGLIMDDPTLAWESVPPMNFGHAEFGFVESGDYLYVVSGDLHTPPEKEGEVPLLYSTVERLNLSEPDAEWEVWALLTGVNFYPEVQVAGDRIHVVGGIYGNPFSPFPRMTEANQIKDMLDFGSGLWGELDLDTKPVIGDVGLYLPYGVLGSNIQNGVTPSPAVGDDIIVLPNATSQPDVTVLQVPPPRITSPVSGETLQAGEEYTIRWEGSGWAANYVDLYFRENSFPTTEWELITPMAGSWKFVGGANQFFPSFKWRVGKLYDGYYGGPTRQYAQIKMCPSAGYSNFDPDCSGVIMGGSGISEWFKFNQEFWVANLQPQSGAYDDNDYPLFISWDYHGANAKVKLEYRISGGGWQLITDSISAVDKGYTWYTPNVTGDQTLGIKATISPPTYRRDVDYLPGIHAPRGFETVYDSITIRDLGEDLDWVEITSPLGGEIWEPGTIHDITWTTNMFGVDAALSYTLNGDDDSPLWAHVGVAPVSDGIYSWTLPPNVYSEHVRININSVSGNNTASDTSEEFGIKSSIELSSLLAKALIDGSFVTTVGEHFIINTTSSASSQAGELGSDYVGEPLSEAWEVGKVSHLGHLRFTVVEEVLTYEPITGPGGMPAGGRQVKSYQVIPVPQGRYGHKLTNVNSYMYVFGGASWAKEITIGKADYNTASQQVDAIYQRSFKSFWVIDDAIHPIHEISQETDGRYPSFSFGNLNYEFKGNITYRNFSAAGTSTTWIGSSNGALDDFTFKNNADNKAGRAFFGLASYTLGSDDLIAIGGLVNQSDNQDRYDRVGNFFSSVNGLSYVTTIYRMPVISTSEVERMAGGWINDQSYIHFESGSEIPIYNLQAFGLDGGVVVYTGQTDFQYGLPGPGGARQQFAAHDPHVPDVSFGFSPRTQMYIYSPSPTQNRWYAMADIPGGDVDYFSAHGLSLIGVASEAPFRTVYRLGGIDANAAAVTSKLRALGPFGSGATLPHAEIEINPARVYADDEDFTTVTMTVSDFFGDAVSNVTVWLSQVDLTQKDFDSVTAAAGWEPIQREDPNDLSVGGVVTDANGIAKFEVRSTRAGDVQLCAGIAPNECQLGFQVPVINFVPKLTLIEPDLGAQGTTIDLVKLDIMGVDLTQYTSDAFKIEFGSNTASDFYVHEPAVSVRSDGESWVETTVTTPMNIVYPITLTATIDHLVGFPLPTGGFGPDREQSFTNDNLASGISWLGLYYAGDHEGISRINFTATSNVVDGQSAYASILVIEEDEFASSLFDLSIGSLYGDTFTPGDLTHLVGLFEFNNDPQSGAEVHFLTSENGALQPPFGTTDEGGRVISQFTIGDRLGPAGIVAYTIYNQRLYFDILSFTVDLADTGLTASNVTVVPNSSTTLRFELDIGLAARLGFWQVTANVGSWYGIDMPGIDDFEVVLPTDPDAARLISITPNTSPRGNILYGVVIQGENTVFLSGYSMPAFVPSSLAPLDIGNRNGITVVEDSVQVNEVNQTITATVEIASNATPGWWNVVVTTQVGDDYTATDILYGDKDFLVTVGNYGYFIDLVSDPYSLPADGGATADETTTVALMNENTGEILERFGGQIVDFINDDTTDNPMNPTSDATDFNGRAYTTYQANTTPGEVTISASTLLEETLLGDIPLNISLVLIKTVNLDLTFFVTADPDTINLNDPGRTSVITVTLWDKDGNPSSQFTGQAVTLSLNGPGSFLPNPIYIGSTGTATTTYFAGLSPQATIIHASTVIIGEGSIEADPATITKTYGGGVRVTLNFLAPFEGNIYKYASDTDAGVWVIVIGVQESTPLINGKFTISTAEGSEGKILNLPAVNVISGTAYTAWVKGTYHLAVAKSFVAPDADGTVTLVFSTDEGRGARIGDIANQTDTFNWINAQDWTRFLFDYFKKGADLLGDFDADQEVGALDWAKFLGNYWQRGDTQPQL